MTPESRERWRRRLAGEYVPIPDQATQEEERRRHRAFLDLLFGPPKDSPEGRRTPTVEGMPGFEPD
jgi:hypothetical protein